MRVLIGFCVVLLVGIALAVGPVMGQKGAAFRDRGRVEREMDNSPGRVAAVLEAMLTQEELDRIESFLFPPPGDAEKAAAYEAAAKGMLSAGLDAGDAVVKAALDAAAAVKPVNPIPIEGKELNHE